MIVIYGDYRCKMIISAVAVFIFFFKILIFVLLNGSKGKKWSKMTKKSVVLNISVTIHHMIVIYCANV